MNWEKETQRIEEFIKLYITISGTKGIILGLSGGIDSAVVAVLAKRAIKKENIHCYYLPMLNTNDDIDKKHIKKLCERFDLTYKIREIGLDTEGIIDDSFTEGISKLNYGNIKARIRMTILYHYANRLNCLVVGTTNKSEYKIGYFTKYGDGAVDFEPIQHLYKTEIFELAKYLNIPEEIINKHPTAGLWKDQTDEKEIGMSYEQLDKILKFIKRNIIIKKQKSYSTSWGNIETCDINKVLDMMNSAKHKQKQPPSLESMFVYD